jgi:hypothetical protein
MMTPAPYTLLFGQGRSGTNWFLDLFQVSQQTFCRQPFFDPESPLADLLPHRFVIKRDCDQLLDIWDDTLARTLQHMGSRDPHIVYPKDYLGVFGNTIGRKVVGKRSVRKAIGFFSSGIRKKEWIFPGWLGNREGLLGAPAIIKFHQAPGLANFALKHRPKVPVFQIIRHPGGFLNSWATRYLGHQDGDSVLWANRNRLKRIAEADPTWAARFGDPDSIGVEEAELWYWCYANETSYDLGSDRENYRAVPFEMLAQDPLPIMQDLYEIIGLTWDQTIAERILATSSQSSSIAGQWKNRLKPHQRELVERILDNSSLKNFWEPTDP